MRGVSVAAALVLGSTNALQTVVLGGGFAGLYTALNLASDGSKVTLVDSSERFGFLPLLYEYATGLATEEEVSAPFADLTFGTSVEFVHADVVAIDAESKTATLGDGTSLTGDALVIALGKESSLDGPGVVELAMPFYRLDDARALREKLLAGAKSVAIVGAGYTGVELACHLSSMDPACDVTLISRSGILGSATAENQAAGKIALEKRGVTVKCDARVKELTKAGDLISVVLEEEDTLDAFDVVVWTAGAKLAGAVREMPQKHKQKLAPYKTPVKRSSKNAPLSVDAALRLRGAEGVFAVGDNAAVAGVKAAPSAQVALQQAVVAARNVRATVQSQGKLRTFSYIELGELVSFSEKDGAASFLPDVAALLPAAASSTLQVNGPIAQLARRIIYAARMPTRAQRITALSSLANNKRSA